MGLFTIIVCGGTSWAPSPTANLIFTVGAIHESPTIVCGNRSFSGGETPPLQEILKFGRRGELCSPVFTYDNRLFRDVEALSPTKNQTFCAFLFYREYKFIFANDSKTTFVGGDVLDAPLFMIKKHRSFF